MKILKWVDKNLEEFIMCVLLVVLTCIMMLQVILRYVFKSPLAWAEEACRYCFIYSIMLATAYCTRRGTMLRVDVVINLFPKKAALVLDMFAQTLAIAFCIIMLRPAWNVMQSAYQLGNVSSALELPMWILYSSAPIGFALGIIRGIQVLVLSIRNFVRVWKGEESKR